MKQYSHISFDLQGTLSDSRFSDEFWMELLPEWYANKHHCTIKKAKLELAYFFRDVGPYDYRYYDWRYWATELEQPVSFSNLVSKLRHQPILFEPMLSLITELHEKNIALIIISSTTHDFIRKELGDASRYFSQIYSSLDDFKMPGKPSQLYKDICSRLGVDTDTVLHIGDSREMDITNAKAAGLETYFMDRSIEPAVHYKNLQAVYNL